jgi:exodeoxyribonuclease-1
VLPLAAHPGISNRVIVCDLDADPQPLIDFDADDIADRLYTPSADLPEGETRIALKEVHLNRCPALIELRHLTAQDIDRLQLDIERCNLHADLLRGAAGLAEKVRQVYSRPFNRDASDADQALYDGFPEAADKAQCVQARRADGDALARNRIVFRDPRYNELMFRYRARNWPESLTADEQERWNGYRQQRLNAESELSEYSFDSYLAEIDALRLQRGAEPGVNVTLDALQAWGLQLRTSL